MVDEYGRKKSKKPNPKLPFPFNVTKDKTPPKIPAPTAPPTVNG